MSFEAAAWAIQQTPKSAREKLLLIVLADCHNRETGRCDPSISYLCKHALCARATTISALTSLEEQGLIRRVRFSDSQRIQYALPVQPLNQLPVQPVNQFSHLTGSAIEPEPVQPLNRTGSATEPEPGSNQEVTRKSGSRTGQKVFKPPTTEQVAEYMAERGCQDVDQAETFVDFYSSKDWHVGKPRMKDWKASVRNWLRRDRKTKPAGSVMRGAI